MTAAVAIATPVNTRCSRGTAYLEVVAVRRGVRVQRTDSGRTLNPFWDVWLRKLLLSKANVRLGLSVKLDDKSVFVSSSRISPESLVAVVQSIASVIVPIPSPPIRRRKYSIRSSSAFWWVDDDADVTECLRRIRLPKGSTVDGGESLVILNHSRRSPFRIGIICRMVELHVALALQGS